jgi:hypothetical protein
MKHSLLCLNVEMLTLFGCSCVQEYVHQAYADVIPYADIAITLSVKDMPNLLQILEAVPFEQIIEYRRQMWVASDGREGSSRPSLCA